MGIHKREDMMATAGFLWSHMEDIAEKRLNFSVDGIKGAPIDHHNWLKENGVAFETYFIAGSEVFFDHDSDATLFYLAWGK